MVVILRTNNSADWDESLPKPVKQLLQSSNSQEEQDKATRAELNIRYYKNEQYGADFLGDMASTAAELQRKKQLWESIKPLFNVCTQAVDVDKRICFKDAHPLLVKRDKVIEARVTGMWERQRWAERAKLSPFFGASRGASYFHVIPGVLSGNPKVKSRLDVLPPEIVSVLRDPFDHNRITAVKIEWLYAEWDTELTPTPMGTVGEYFATHTNYAVGLGARESLHVYTKIITEEAYYTFRDHIAHDFGYGKNSWANTLGVVPMEEVPFNDIGEDVGVKGLPTFHSILPTCDRVNELLSMMGNILKIHADPIPIGYGVNPERIIEKKLEEKGVTYLYIPLPTPMDQMTKAAIPPHLEYLEYKGESVGALVEFVEMVVALAERAIPESLWGKNGPRTGSGSEAEVDLQPLEEKLLDIRENQFNGLEDAMQLAMIADDLGAGELNNEQALERIDEAREKYDFKFWAAPVLGRNRAVEEQMHSVAIADGKMSRFTAMLESGKTYAQAEEELRRIDEEKEQALQFELRKARLMAEAMPQPTVGGSAASKATKPTLPTKGGQGSIPAANVRTANQPQSRPNNPRQK